MIYFKFNQKKTTQVASIFLKKEGLRKEKLKNKSEQSDKTEDSMAYMKLLKLLYFTDREALSLWQRPLSGDNYVSMEDGPVLSGVLGMINYGEEYENSEYWYQHISHPYTYSTPENKKEHSVKLDDMPETDELSQRELKLIDEIYDQFGEFDQYELVIMSHDICPEWDEKAREKSTSIVLSINDILHASGKTPEEIEEIREEVETLNYVDELLELDN